MNVTFRQRLQLSLTLLTAGLVSFLLYHETGNVGWLYAAAAVVAITILQLARTLGLMALELRDVVGQLGGEES